MVEGDVVHYWEGAENASGDKKQLEQPSPAAKLLFYPIRSGKGIELTAAEENAFKQRRNQAQTQVV